MGKTSPARHARKRRAQLGSPFPRRFPHDIPNNAKQHRRRRPEEHAHSFPDRQSGRPRSGGARKGPRGFVGHWKTGRAVTHSTARTSQTARPLGSGEGPLRHCRSDRRHGVGKCPGRRRLRRVLGRRQGFDRIGSRGIATFVSGVARAGTVRVVPSGAHHVCHTLALRRELRPILRPLLAAFHRFEPQMAVPLAAYTALSKLRDLV